MKSPDLPGSAHDRLEPEYIDVALHRVNSSITGYAEGYYGRLLCWSERAQILRALKQYRLNCYYYAPKEDPYHRLEWRKPYPEQWREHFRQFCALAKKCGVRVVAGVAPGLDFDFSQLPAGEDFLHLVQKCKALLSDGADAVSLLMDDIDPDFERRCGLFESEGQAHAALANELANALIGVPGSHRHDLWANPYNIASESLPLQSTRFSSVPLWVTPRIYADELISDSPGYLPAFVDTLDVHHSIMYCGSDVVASVIDQESAESLRHHDPEKISGNPVQHRVIYWDNLYANDYCPRRLFIGPWLRRDVSFHIMLNATGLVFTDCLLLELMAKVIDRPSVLDTPEKTAETAVVEWLDVLSTHGVPKAFLKISDYFYHPVFNQKQAQKARKGELTDPYNTVGVNDSLKAIEECLWRWKTPLSREWYPYIFGLKHDLLSSIGRLPPERVVKTQLQPLAGCLLSASRAEPSS